MSSSSSFSHQQPAGIPFPQSQERHHAGPSTEASPRSLLNRGGLAKAEREGEIEQTAMATSSSQPFQAAADDEDQSRHARSLTRSTASTASSSSSMRGGGAGPAESLPSIRNLFNIINNDDHSPAAKNNGPASSSTFPAQSHQRRQTTEAGGGHAQYPTYNASGLAGPAWGDSRSLGRSMSPTKRPPIAPSAFAHSHYIPTSMNPTQQQPSTSYTAPASSSAGTQRSTSSIRHSPSSSASGRLPMELPKSIRTSGVRTAGAPAPLVISGHPYQQAPRQHPFPGIDQVVNDPHDQQSGHLTKRTHNSHSEQQDEMPLSPASVRRRHTVGALEEPVNLFSSGADGGMNAKPSLPQQDMLHSRDQQQMLDARRADETTPRGFHSNQLRSPARPGLDSPTTPTAGHAAPASLAYERGDNQGADARHDPSARNGREGAVFAVPHRVYMQHHSSQSTASMPSLSSSISSASTGSERARVHSFEGGDVGAGLEGVRHHQNAPPSAWHGAAPAKNVGKSSLSGSETFLTSPHSSVWHSRSSTLDSIETTSSIGSTPSANSYRRRQDGSLERTAREGPTTPTHNRNDYNREWRFPQAQTHLQGQGQQAQSHGQHLYHQSPVNQLHSQQQHLIRTRHESLNERGRSHVGNSEHPTQLPRSPFANLSLASPPASSNDVYSRPRAQTMNYADRRIAPLPSHSVHSQMAAPGAGGMPHSIMPQRSYSSQSASSLSQRTSAMDIDVGGAPPTLYEDVDHTGSFPRRRLSSSSGRPTSSSTMIVSAASPSASGSGAGTAKYECGWCGKRFSRPSSLKIHHHSHTGEKPFVCNEAGCGRTFSVQSNLRRHQKSHIANARKGKLGGMGMGHYDAPTPMSGPSSTYASAMGHVGISQSSSMPIPSRMHFHGAPDVERPPSQTMTLIPLSSSSSSVPGVHSSAAAAAGPRMGSGQAHFASLRDRRTSFSSSTAADGDDEEEEEEDDEDNGGVEAELHHRRLGSDRMGAGSKRHFAHVSEAGRGSVGSLASGASDEQDDADATVMQDIHEESAIQSSPDTRPATAGSMQSRFQGLLGQNAG